MPSLVPVVQLAQPGKLLGRMVERSGALAPSRIRRDRFGNRPSFASGVMRSKVAPSSPMITVFIFAPKGRRILAGDAITGTTPPDAPSPARARDRVWSAAPPGLEGMGDQSWWLRHRL